ncbi:MAG: hypothetical protein Q8R37_05630 [Nanoarchaeota archaeon]|nr:hypothetical protein [Nanoarchaeota archaeon]
MKQFSKILFSVGIGISSLSYYSVTALQEQLQQQESSYQIQNYVNTNLDKIIQDQEKKLNIVYQGRPIVEVGISEETKNAFPSLSICGYYDSEENSIYFKKDITINPLPDKDGLEISPENSCTIKEVLDHELGHFYVDMLSEQLKHGSWPQTLRENGKVDENAIHIIGEGIAEYFGRTMNGHYDNFKDEEWPTKLEDFYMLYDQNGKKIDLEDPPIPNYRLWYQGGYHLVKPIIDEFSVNGIHYLMFHPPTEEELINLKEYQQKVIRQLRKK